MKSEVGILKSEVGPVFALRATPRLACGSRKKGIKLLAVSSYLMVHGSDDRQQITEDKLKSFKYFYSVTLSDQHNLAEFEKVTILIEKMS